MANKVQEKKLVKPLAPVGQMPLINKGGTSKESPGAVNNPQDQAFPGTESKQNSNKAK